MRVLVDPARTSGAVMDILGSRAVATAVSPAAVMKSVKNDVQIAGVRDAMVDKQHFVGLRQIQIGGGNRRVANIIATYVQNPRYLVESRLPECATPWCATVWPW